MREIVVRLTIPVADEELHGRNLVFTHWLPLSGDENITATRDGLHLRLWLDMTCLGHVGKVQVDEIERHINL